MISSQGILVELRVFEAPQNCHFGMHQLLEQRAPYPGTLLVMFIGRGCWFEVRAHVSAKVQLISGWRCVQKGSKKVPKRVQV